MSKTKEHLDFIYNRLLEVHGEKENVDYMLKFKNLIDTYFSDPVKNIKQEELENPNRFFFICYSYFREKSFGNGNFALVYKKFPSKHFLIEKASELANAKQIVILSIQELSAEDFSDYIS
jgi:hypothetical protein